MTPNEVLTNLSERGFVLSIPRPGVFSVQPDDQLTPEDIDAIKANVVGLLELIAARATTSISAPQSPDPAPASSTTSHEPFTMPAPKPAPTLQRESSGASGSPEPVTVPGVQASSAPGSPASSTPAPEPPRISSQKPQVGSAGAPTPKLGRGRKRQTKPAPAAVAGASDDDGRIILANGVEVVIRPFSPPAISNLIAQATGEPTAQLPGYSERRGIAPETPQAPSAPASTPMPAPDLKPPAALTPAIPAPVTASAVEPAPPSLSPPGVIRDRFVPEPPQADHWELGGRDASWWKANARYDQRLIQNEARHKLDCQVSSLVVGNGWAGCPNCGAVIESLIFLRNNAPASPLKSLHPDPPLDPPMPSDAELEALLVENVPGILPPGPIVRAPLSDSFVIVPRDSTEQGSWRKGQAPGLRGREH